jgi:hypothetical protein
MPACRLDRRCFESRRKGAVCQNRPINEQQMLIWPQIGASLPLGLTLDRQYFQLAKPLERRLYELARKHVGQQVSFKIGLEKLRAKCGAQSTLKEFRRLLQTIIDADQLHDHMPGYGFSLDGDMVEMRTKSKLPSSTQRGVFIHLNEDAYELGRSYAPGWDIHGIEAEWRAWIARKKISPLHAQAHFLAFGKRRGKYPGFSWARPPYPVWRLFCFFNEFMKTCIQQFIKF